MIRLPSKHNTIQQIQQLQIQALPSLSTPEKKMSVSSVLRNGGSTSFVMNKLNFYGMGSASAPAIRPTQENAEDPISPPVLLPTNSSNTLMSRGLGAKNGVMRVDFDLPPKKTLRELIEDGFPGDPRPDDYFEDMRDPLHPNPVMTSQDDLVQTFQTRSVPGDVMDGFYEQVTGGRSRQNDAKEVGKFAAQQIQRLGEEINKRDEPFP